MSRTPSTPTDDTSRRAVLTAGAVGCSLSLGLSGCLSRAQRVVDRDTDDQLSLSLVTVPADDDRPAVRIARHLESHLEAVGIDVTVATRSRTAFLETVLHDSTFDLYVGRRPVDFDPDFLYETLHSRYAGDGGWQNPFGLTNVAFDRLLEHQRERDGDTRADAVASVLRSFVREKPFEPICVPDEHRIARTDRITGWDEAHPATRRGYLGLEPVASEATGGSDTNASTDGDTDPADSESTDSLAESIESITALVTDARPSLTLNPVSATTRERRTVIDLLYDSLGVVDGDEVRSWLAESWTWDETGDGDGGESGTETDDTETAPVETDGTDTDTGTGATLTITLREGCQFHDGESVTAADVAFTYRFLADTTLGRASVPSPAPYYQGQAAAVDEIRVVNERQVTLGLATGREAGRRVLTVPILPEHVWHERVTDRIDPADDVIARPGQWHVVTTDNVPPVGSGPYQFVDRSERDHVTLERFADHFTRREAVALPEPTAEELRFEVDPGSASALARVRAGDADVTASMLDPNSIADIPAVEVDDDSDTDADGGDSNAAAIDHLESPSRTVYHVGFNTRREPLSNVHVRRTIAQLLDKSWLVDDVFDGHARPTAIPVDREWVPPDLEWDGTDPVAPFLGADGTLDVEAARSAFEAIGFRYDEAETRLFR